MKFEIITKHNIQTFNGRFLLFIYCYGLQTICYEDISDLI